jgi:dTDP-glucose 4,6-dehydratase
MTNVVGTQNLLDISLKFGVDRYIQISTDEVYGSLGDRGYFTEETPLNPHSPYSASKASADLIVKSYHDTYDLPVNITRCSNNYGPYQFPEKLIPLTINNCLEGKEIPLYGNGLNVRDWLYVEDHCAAIDAVINEGISGDIYNIGGNNELSNIELVKLIIQCISESKPDLGVSEELITYVNDRKGHDWRYAIDAAKIRRDLGWRPNIKFDDGIKRTISWYLNNQEWLRSIVTNDYINYYNSVYKFDQLRRTLSQAKLVDQDLIKRA